MAASLKPYPVFDHSDAFSEGLLDKEHQVNGTTVDKSPAPHQGRILRSSSRKRSNSKYVDNSKTAKKPKTGKVDHSTSAAAAAVSSTSVHGRDSGLPDVHLYDSNAEGSAPASDKNRQTEFLKLMGWKVSTSIPDSESQALDDKEASILAAANQHMSVPSLKERSNEKVKNDGYYTEQTMNYTIKKALDTHAQNAPMCTCEAHKAVSETSSSTDQAKNNYKELIRVPQEVNDDKGKKFAVTLIKQIFDHLKIKDKTVTATEMGTDWDVDFALLDHETTNKIRFRGWGDFCICHQEKNAGAEELLISVGEIESQGTNTAAKLGIYSIGQFRRKTGVPKRFLPSVGIYKDKAAIICIAERTPPKESSAEDLGRVSFKVVEGADRLDLKSTKGVQDFTRKLTATINFALKNN